MSCAQNTLSLLLFRPLLKCQLPSEPPVALRDSLPALGPDIELLLQPVPTADYKRHAVLRAEGRGVLAAASPAPGPGPVFTEELNDV